MTEAKSGVAIPIENVPSRKYSIQSKLETGKTGNPGRCESHVFHLLHTRKYGTGILSLGLSNERNPTDDEFGTIEPMLSVVTPPCCCLTSAMISRSAFVRCLFASHDLSRTLLNGEEHALKMRKKRANEKRRWERSECDIWRRTCLWL